MGVRFLIDSARSGGGFSCVEHPIAPRTLGSPSHTEDEYSFVLEGRIGVLLGDEVLEARAGDLVFEPRGEPHAFWNATDEPARFLKIISPAGFEQYFAEAAVMFPATGERDMEAFAELSARYGLESASTRRRGSSPRTGSSLHRRGAGEALIIGAGGRLGPASAA